MSGCVQEYDFTVVNEEYVVKDIYKGFTNGYTVTVVEYYDDNNNIITVTNERRFDGRVNSFIVKRSLRSYSYIYKYQINDCPYNTVTYGKAAYPRARYMLYLHDSTDSIGINTHTQNSNRPDDYSYIERVS